MFGISTTELVIILIFAFLLFGPDKLPQMGRTIGRALRQFKETQEKLTAVVQTEVVDPMTEAAAEPPKPKKKKASTTAEGASGEAEDADSDADAEGASGEPAHRAETFAERRARLAAEKAQSGAGAAAATVAAADGAGDEDSDLVPGEDDSAEGASKAPAEEDALSEEEAKIRRTQDLYARRPRKKKAEPEAEPETAAEAEPEAEPEPAAAADEPPAQEAAAPAGSEEGGEQ